MGIQGRVFGTSLSAGPSILAAIALAWWLANR
jgi:hypothetical protein